MKEKKPKKVKIYGQKDLDQAFSWYVRLRDANEDGICKCFTCNHRAFWKDFDCGHGHGRQHNAIRYHLWNNHAQCAHCNLDGGRQDVYQKKVNELYGPDAWDILASLKRQKQKAYSAFEYEHLTKHWLAEFEKLKLIKQWQR